VDYADLAILDFSKAVTPEGRAELAATARDALHNIGFFCIVNHGMLQTEVSSTQHLRLRVDAIHEHQTERIFDIADIPFTQVSDHEKQIYEGKMMETGSYEGYKPRQYWVSTSDP
jgi:isopenicillin N synthase-like dioxygenase